MTIERKRRKSSTTTKVVSDYFYETSSAEWNWRGYAQWCMQKAPIDEEEANARFREEISLISFGKTVGTANRVILAGLPQEALDELVTNQRAALDDDIRPRSLKLHNSFFHGEPLTIHEKMMMKIGLSHILDLSDETDTSQKTLFTALQWEQLKTKYHARFDTRSNDLPPQVEHIWLADLDADEDG
ncbi:hypothetical protein BZG36_01494 [Bifiguratus adelaidae]|uniref:Uncharacterized protein n=1 Tax=Bifiguratus adelaidae TaxID=1938954 RepID=A0A261Y4Z3_9FUNG|nr:hypothetical protein BZG36_01494 [Bifiguratus adelaidae]